MFQTYDSRIFASKVLGGSQRSPVDGEFVAQHPVSTRCELYETLGEKMRESSVSNAHKRFVSHCIEAGG